VKKSLPTNRLRVRARKTDPEDDARYRLSELAEIDVADILDFTVDTWGPEQADRYLDHLVGCFDRIAHMPSLGRDCSAVHPGFRRIEEGRHVIFYRVEEFGIFIARVVHQKMLVTKEFLMERTFE